MRYEKLDNLIDEAIFGWVPVGHYNFSPGELKYLHGLVIDDSVITCFPGVEDSYLIKRINEVNED